MAAAVALSNYQLGDILGRGASGSVYRALNFLTGETVAIKSISLLSLAPSSLPDIMSEIDLLKNLNHPNIVKYKGFARDKDNLFIVLEYCENGSLQTILKKFGKFPESLVAVYIAQVLDGLIYLHEQGVIHRDIKGANILTNKDGSVKLADFGVSSRAQGAVEGADNEVVGSPYWMAPEVIEQSGASTASDIWSVGCVIVELLEGKPPYGDLAPMQALWRIVQDESMRIPDGASPIVKDFLYHCFQKDPNLRVSAKKLLRHPWMLSTRKAVDPSPPLSLPLSRVSSTQARPLTASVRVSSNEKRVEQPPAAAEKGGTVRSKPMTVYDEAVQRVQEWNEALNASPTKLGTMRKVPSTRHARQPSAVRPETARNIFNAPTALPSRGSADSVTAQAPSSANPSPAHPGILQKNLHLTNALYRAKEKGEEEGSWDDDFASDISLSKIEGHRRKEPSISEEPDQMTLKPTRHVSPSPMPPPPVPRRDVEKPRVEASTARSVGHVGVEDYSDIMGDDDIKTGLESKLSNLKLKNKTRKGILHPDDLRKLKGDSKPPPLASSSRLPETPRSLPSTPRLAPPPSPSLAPPHSRISSLSPPSSRQNSVRDRKPSESELELRKYTENDDDDYEDIFDGAGEQSTIGTQGKGSLVLTKRSNRSWSEEGEHDEVDPFAEMEDEWEGGADDIEANLLRDKRATLQSNLSKLLERLEGGTSAGELREVCDQIFVMLENTPDMGLEKHFVASHGMHSILEVLESRLSRDVAVRILKIVNLIVSADVDMLESFCLIGGIPVIMPFTSKKHSDEIRLEASTFIHQLTRSALTLQMFISCRGLKVLVEMLDEDYSINKALVLSSLEGIHSVFDLQSPTPRNDFCRMFVREGIVDPLSTAMLAILKDPSAAEGDGPGRAVTVLLLFCQVAQADEKVRMAFATRTIMLRLLKACEALPRKLLVSAVKAIKHLSTSPQLIEVLQNSNGMEMLVGLLGKSIKGSHSNEICSHIFQTVYSMCRLSKARQEEAASSGIIPLLKKVIQNKSPLKQFALPILCDLASAGKLSRRLLWQNDGLKLYLNLLEDPYWRVSALEAILAWLLDETARVEDVLSDAGGSESLMQCFVLASGVSFEGILDPFLKILRISPAITTSIAHPPFFRRLADSLSSSAGKASAVAKLNLLRITRVACEHHPDRVTVVSRFSLAKIVEVLGKQDDAILVRELAKEIYPSLLFGNDTGAAMAGVVRDEGRKGVQRASTGLGLPQGTMRRTTSETVIPLSSALAALEQDEKGRGEGSMPSRRYLPSSSESQPRELPATTSMASGGSTSRSRDGNRLSMIGTPLRNTTTGEREKPKHKRQISRSQLKEVQWQTDENGKVKSVRTPMKPPPL